MYALEEAQEIHGVGLGESARRGEKVPDLECRTRLERVDPFARGDELEA